MAVEKALMKLLLVCLFLVACTKPNPNRCCTDQADCTANNIAVDSTCDVGLLCRGHQCISVPCNSSANCDESAPYCVADSCGMQCDDDGQCPGYSQSGEYCVAGGCVECRDSADCSAAAPVCDASACRLCEAHLECGTGACAADGTCASESSIAYIDANGAATSDCTRSSPCSTITRALALMPARPYLVIAAGAYPNAAALSPSAERWLIGTGAPPSLTRTTDGPIISVTGGGADLHLDNLIIEGATGNSGDGIYFTQIGAVAELTLHHVTVRNNSQSGLNAVGPIVATESTFSNNGFQGVRLSESVATFDRCLVTENDAGMDLDGGRYTVTNTLISRNTSSVYAVYGINLYSTIGGHRIEFNTIVDNVNLAASVGAGFGCNLSAATSFPNNIIARNTKQTQGSNCFYPNSLISDADISALKFRSPDTAPYDYHLQTGSTAIDAATVSTVDHDFDGDARPNGPGRDVGADEYVP